MIEIASGSLREFVNIPAFRKLSDSFSRITGLAAAILDLKGEILVSSGWQSICTDYHRKCGRTAARCLESDTVLSGIATGDAECSVYKCRNGLVDVAVPIVIENEHAGNVFIGQFLLERPDVELFARQAEEHGFDKASYLDALTKVPVISTDYMNQAIAFLKNMTTIIGSSGLDRKRLFALNSHLEQRIEERTAELTDSNERLRALSEASFEGIIITEHDIVLDANDRMASMVGFRQGAELVGRRVTGFIAPEARADVEGRMRSGYEGRYETLGLTKDGAVFPIEVHGKTFAYKGRLVRASTVRDLTEKKKAEMELQDLRTILPICSFCKKIRDDKGYWEQVDIFFHKHADKDFSHSICPDCLKKHYPTEHDG
jgi:PAS domain S-box-containing protein